MVISKSLRVWEDQWAHLHLDVRIVWKSEEKVVVGGVEECGLNLRHKVSQSWQRKDNSGRALYLLVKVLVMNRL